MEQVFFKYLSVITLLPYRSGKIVCTGTRNEHDSYIASRKFARIIQKLGFPVSKYIYTEISLDFLYEPHNMMH